MMISKHLAGSLTALCQIPLMFALCTFGAHAQDMDWKDGYRNRVPTAESAIEPLDSPFGENINLFTGGVSFLQTDVTLKGNGPDIVIARRYMAGQYYGSLSQDFGDWEFMIPQIRTVVEVPTAGPYGGIPIDGAVASWIPEQRCTKFAQGIERSPTASDMSYSTVDGWQEGAQWITPSGSQELLARIGNWQPSQPINGTTAYTAVTLSGWSFGCLPSAANVEGEAFLAIDPSGTKYWANNIDYRPYPNFRQPDDELGRAFRMFRSRASSGQRESRTGSGIT